MSCPHCGHVCPPGSKFCNECGARIDVAAPVRAPRDYTPPHLVEQILNTRAALEGERKQITVLFADVRRSMELAEQVDPEDWHQILDRFFQILAGGIHRFGGTVNQYTGDGIMALFGAPIAHEDHAHRACSAALHLAVELRRYAEELKRTRELGFAVRMGLNSGEVVVGRIGDDLRMDYTAQGHAVGLAQRMEQLAAADRAYLTEHTARLVRGRFVLRDLGPFALKGVRDPVRVYELEGSGPFRTRLDVSRARGFSRFVGRDSELEVLERSLDQALAGFGQIVGVVGEPGVGKSRLCDEFVERCRARGLLVGVSHGVSHGRAVPLLPVLSMYRSALGLSERHPDRVTREKIAGRYLLLDPTFADDLPLVFDFLGVPDPERPAPRLDPEALTRRLQDLSARYIVARSRSEAAVLLFEDLHWFDDASLAWLPAMLEAVTRTRTLCVTNFRPEFEPPWRRWPAYREIALARLAAGASEEQLDDLLGRNPSLRPLRARILEVAAGNPFFTEEIVVSLVEAGSLVGSRGGYRLAGGSEQLPIPETVQAVLAARIDRLSDDEKALLQTAAVIGRSFPRSVLERVTELVTPALDAALGELARHELVFEQALQPEIEYSFKHPLTQEVAYASQLSERRRRTHAAVARAIEAADPDRLEERAALLAQHWEEAREPTIAARWHGRAAAWIGSRDRREMVAHWRRVRALLGAAPETPETLALAVTARHQMLVNEILLGPGDDRAPALFAEGLALAERLGDPFLHIRLVMGYGIERLFAGEVREAVAVFQNGISSADASGHPLLRFGARGPAITVFSVAGLLEESVRLSDENEDLCGGDAELLADFTGFSPLAMELVSSADSLIWLGRLADAARALERAVEIARRRGDAEVLVSAHRAQVFWAEFSGDTRDVLRLARQASAQAPEGSAMRITARGALGIAHRLMGQWPEAIAALEAARSLLHQMDAVRFFEPLCVAELAHARLGAGELAAAAALAEEAVALARRIGTPLYELRAWRVLARTAVKRHDEEGPAPVERALAEAAALVERTGARAMLPFLACERAELARLRGDQAGRRRALGEARQLFAAMGAGGHAESAAAALGTPG
jgi:class 3 adenylate cyclase/tetratricopeptide (TPR) repeat protein